MYAQSASFGRSRLGWVRLSRSGGGAPISIPWTTTGRRSDQGAVARARLGTWHAPSRAWECVPLSDEIDPSAGAERMTLRAMPGLDQQERAENLGYGSQVLGAGGRSAEIATRDDSDCEREQLREEMRSHRQRLRLSCHKKITSPRISSRFPDVPLRPRMRVEQCWVTRPGPLAGGVLAPSRFPDASLSARMRVEQCWVARAARRRALSGARLWAEPGSARREPTAGQGSESAPGRNRTCDLALRRRALYPLSYRRGASSLARENDGPARGRPVIHTGSELRSSVVEPGVLHAQGLARSELRVARVVRVVHVVVDRVEAGLGAGVLAGRAAGSWSARPGCRPRGRPSCCSHPRRCARGSASGRPRALRSRPGRSGPHTPSTSRASTPSRRRRRPGRRCRCGSPGSGSTPSRDTGPAVVR